MPETGRSQAMNLDTRNKRLDQNAPITRKHEFPKKFAKMIDGTDQNNPKFLRSLQNAQSDTTNLAVKQADIAVLKIKYCLKLLAFFKA